MADGGLPGKEQRGLSEAMEMFRIFTCALHGFLHFKIQQTVYLRSVHFAICKLYLNK